MRSAVIAAVVSALVSAASGVAATKYVLSSTRQISPHVLAQLAAMKAKTSIVQGPAGPAGNPGKSIVGPQGEPGQSIEGAAGPVGESVRGPEGKTGPRGERGESIVGPSSVFVVEERITELRELYIGQRLSSAATCPEGSTPIGGGGFRSEPEDIGVITSTGPNEANGWATTIEVTHPPTPAYTGAVEATFVVWANCIR